MKTPEMGGQSPEKKERTADYLALGKVLMDKGTYDNPQAMRDFFQRYVADIRDEGIQADPEKFAREIIDGFLNDYEYGIKQWRKMLDEKNPETEK